jgi:hypothetical protein
MPTWLLIAVDILSIIFVIGLVVDIKNGRVS